jgi:hypothetical protein
MGDGIGMEVNNTLLFGIMAVFLVLVAFIVKRIFALQQERLTEKDRKKKEKEDRKAGKKKGNKE